MNDAAENFFAALSAYVAATVTGTNTADAHAALAEELQK